MASIESRIFSTKTGEAIMVRIAVPHDASPMLSFARAAAATTDQLATQPDEFDRSDEEERKIIEESLSHDGKLLLLATHEEDIIGNLQFKAHHRRRFSHTGTLGMLVHHAWRGKGVGTALVQVLLDWARAHPTIEKVCLSVFDSNATGLALYKKTGFREEGRRKGQAKLAPNRYADEIFMGLWVKPPLAG